MSVEKKYADGCLKSQVLSTIKCNPGISTQMLRQEINYAGTNQEFYAYLYQLRRRGLLLQQKSGRRSLYSLTELGAKREKAPFAEINNRKRRYREKFKKYIDAHAKSIVWDLLNNRAFQAEVETYRFAIAPTFWSRFRAACESNIRMEQTVTLVHRTVAAKKSLDNTLRKPMKNNQPL